MKKQTVDIGIFGGSGFYSFLENPQKIRIKTPYGDPSGEYMIGVVGKKRVAFLPRHGIYHQFPPHVINYRANIFGFKTLGVKYIISPCAAGSLQARVKPGDFVICDQFVDRTWGRKDTFFDGSKTIHIGGSHPYCPHLRTIAVQVGKKLRYPIHSKGTVVVINGPRFSTSSESQWFAKQKWEVINMTQYPEMILAREQEMCFVNISLITDYDAGLKGNKNIKPVSLNQVIQIFDKNNEKVRTMIYEMINKIDVHYQCSCHSSLKGAAF